MQPNYEDAFMCNGRLSHMVQLMGFHPSYLTLFLKCDDFLMHGNGPLPLHVRNYIAILVRLALLGLDRQVTFTCKDWEVGVHFPLIALEVK